MATCNSRSGFTLIETLVVLALGGLVVALSIPALSEALQRAQFDSAVRQVLTDLRGARSQAITTGWEFRLIGSDHDGVGAAADRYRLLGRSSSAVAWPDIDGPHFRAATQSAGAWVEVGSQFPGVRLDAAANTFSVTFDARGAATASGFNPLTIENRHGRTASLSVSIVGGVNLE